MIRSPDLHDRITWGAISVTLLLYALGWTFAQWSSQPNLDRYHDMIESFAWSQTFEWGSFKHPPFFAWVTGAWFTVMPRTDLAFKLLSYANVVVGLAGLAVLARLMGLSKFAHPAVVLLFWCLPYTTLASKFNANAQLLSVWPWAAAALVGSLIHTGWRGFAWSTLLGLCSAAAMLSKYYSGVLLLALFVAALVHRAALSWFLSPRPWWALAVAVLALVPHWLWLQASDFAMLNYALDQGGGEVNLAMVLRFAATPFLYWLPGWVACVLMVAVALRQQGERPRVAGLLLRAWQPDGWRDSLFWLAVTPWAVSLAFGLAGVVELSTPWAIPIGFAFPLLWLRNLSQSVSGRQAGLVALTTACSRITSPRLTATVAGSIAGFAVLLALVYATTGQREYYRATESLAQAVASDWQARHTGERLGWSGGAWPDTAMLAFYVDPAIRALPGTPDSREASLALHRTWAAEHGVLICPDGAQGEACITRMKAWLTGRGLPDTPRTVSAARSGWRFPRATPQSVVVFDVPAGAQGGSSK
jgi:4-amino-4-deoxy-L-arabinose transferase-like glycosyltransferase